jgi:molecular chaperone GrpE (heat shock protein)
VEPRDIPVTLEDLDHALRELRLLIEGRDAASDAHRVALEAMHRDCEAYKNDFLFQAEKRLLLDLLSFHDSLLWFRQAATAPDATPELIEEGTRYLLDEVLELLYRQDIVPIETTESYDRARQKALQVVPTTEAARDRHVHRVLRRGFMRGERVLRPEEVVVWRYRSPSGGSPSGEVTAPEEP